jgi:hypothetical protein
MIVSKALPRDMKQSSISSEILGAREYVLNMIITSGALLNPLGAVCLPHVWNMHAGNLVKENEAGGSIRGTLKGEKIPSPFTDLGS